MVPAREAPPLLVLLLLLLVVAVLQGLQVGHLVLPQARWGYLGMLRLLRLHLLLAPLGQQAPVALPVPYQAASSAVLAP